MTVTPVNDNSPVITSDGGGADRGSQRRREHHGGHHGHRHRRRLPAQTLTYTIIGGADAAKFTINARTGVLTFVAAPDYESPTDAGAQQRLRRDGAGQRRQR